jgi:hypothetical protein
MSSLKSVLLLMILTQLLSSCADSKALIIPEGVKNDFFTGEMGRKMIRIDKLYGREYKVYSDSVMHTDFVDKTLAYGILIPRASLQGFGSESKMHFGTDSVQSLIKYAELKFYKLEEQSSLLGDILFPEHTKVPGHDPYASTRTPLKKIITGTMLNPLLKGEALFWFEHASNENFDTVLVSGWLKMAEDSFYVKPLCKVIPLHGKNVKPMQVLQGYSLFKEDTLLAFLQHAPLVKSLYKSGLKDKLYLNPRVSEREQECIIAYFYLVSRLVYSSGGALY